MPETRFVEYGQEWRRCYTVGELEQIAAALGLKELKFISRVRLQQAIEAYQWSRLADESLSNKGRRQELERVVKLCSPNEQVEELQDALDNLDGPTSHSLGPVGIHDRLQLARTARQFSDQIPQSGQDPKSRR